MRDFLGVAALSSQRLFAETWLLRSSFPLQGGVVLIRPATGPARGQSTNLAVFRGATVLSARPVLSAPRLYSTSRLMMVAITSVHPGCTLHPVHPGCTSGYGDGWAGMLAGAWSGMYAPFSAPPAPKSGWGRPKPPPGRLAESQLLSICKQLLSICKHSMRARFASVPG